MGAQSIVLHVKFPATIERRRGDLEIGISDCTLGSALTKLDSEFNLNKRITTGSKLNDGYLVFVNGQLINDNSFLLKDQDELLITTLVAGG